MGVGVGWGGAAMTLGDGKLGWPLTQVPTLSTSGACCGSQATRRCGLPGEGLAQVASQHMCFDRHAALSRGHVLVSCQWRMPPCTSPAHALLLHDPLLKPHAPAPHLQRVRLLFCLPAHGYGGHVHWLLRPQGCPGATRVCGGHHLLHQQVQVSARGCRRMGRI